MNRYTQTAAIGRSIEPRLAVDDEEGSEVNLLIAMEVCGEAGWQASEGEQAVASFLQAVGDGAMTQLPLAATVSADGAPPARPRCAPWMIRL
jgi:hypothetical protein